MEAGKLRHRLTVQSASTAQDSSGQPIPTWSAFNTRWGSVEPLQGRELFAARQVVAEVTHRIRFRYLAGVVPTQRVIFGTRTFEILTVLNPQERNRELELLCKEVN